MRVRFLTFLLGLSLCGCASLQDYHYCLVQKHRADAAWKENYGIVGHACSRDYSDGWKQGYYDISTGQCEDPPPVPPHKYWEPKYQSLEGKEAIADWYSGWQDGATAAVEDGNSYFHEVAASPTGAGVNSGHGFYSGGESHGHDHQQHHQHQQQGPGFEKLLPAPPMASHGPQPQVHVAPVPPRFASRELVADDELLDESDLEYGPLDQGEESSVNEDSAEQYGAEEYSEEVSTPESGDDAYYAEPTTDEAGAMDQDDSEAAYE